MIILNSWQFSHGNHYWWRNTTLKTDLHKHKWIALYIGQWVLMFEPEQMSRCSWERSEGKIKWTTMIECFNHVFSQQSTINVSKITYQHPSNPFPPPPKKTQRNDSSIAENLFTILNWTSLQRIHKSQEHKTPDIRTTFSLARYHTHTRCNCNLSINLN